MTRALLDIFHHNLWANERLLEACAPLSDELLDASVPGTYGRVRDTLVHLLVAEERYVFRVGGTELPDPLDQSSPFPGFETLRRQARRSGEALARLAEDADLEGKFAVAFGGRDHEVRKAVVLVQAINHSTEHRAHVVTTLSAHGVEPAQIDGWSWGDATGGIRPLGA